MNEQSKTTIERALIAELRESYSATVEPPCRICGGPLSIERAGGGAPTVWRCTGRTDDGYAPGRTLCDSHYESSEWVDRKAGGDERVVLLCDMADASERRAVEAEAGAAAMRKALVRHPGRCPHCNGRGNTEPECADPMCGDSYWDHDCGKNDPDVPCNHCGQSGVHPAIRAALAADAGRAILDRLERAEAIAASMTHEVSAILADARDTEDGLLRQFDDLRRRSRDEARVALMRIGELEAEHNAYHTAAENAYAAQLAAESERDALRAERDQLRKDWDNALSVSTAHFQSEIRALKAELATERGKARKAVACGHCGGSGVTYDPDELEVPEGHVPPEMVCPNCGGSGAVIVEGEP